MRFWIIVTHGYEQREWLKANGFRFERNTKRWKKLSSSDNEYRKICEYSKGRFAVGRQNYTPKAGHRPKRAAAARAPKLPDSQLTLTAEERRQAKIAAERKRKEENAKLMERARAAQPNTPQKPRDANITPARISEPTGTRDDFKKDSARNWSRATRNKNL